MRPCVEWPVAAIVAKVSNAATRPGLVTRDEHEKSTSWCASHSNCATSFEGGRAGQEHCVLSSVVQPLAHEGGKRGRLVLDIAPRGPAGGRRPRWLAHRYSHLVTALAEAARNAA